MALKTTFKVNGPIFDSITKVSDRMIRVVNRGLLEMITIEGSNVVKKQLWGPPAAAYRDSPRSSKHGARTRNLRNHVGANIVKDLVGQVDAGQHRYGRNLVYSNWVEGISPRNAATTFKGYHMFKNAREHLDNNPSLHEKYIGGPVTEAFD